MPIVNGEYVFGSLDLTEESTNTYGQPVIGGEALSTELVRKEQEEEDAQSWYQTLGIATDENTTTLYQGIKDQFTSGGNYAVDMLTTIGRKGEYAPDESFDPSSWIDANRKKLGLEDQYFSALMGAGSEEEALDIVKNIGQRQEAQKRIQRLGITGQLVSGAIAGMFDIDTLLSGGVAGIAGKTGILSTRMGQIMAGTSSGTIAATAGAAASPEDDWENVAIAALFSAGFATAFSKGANPVAEAFNKTVADMQDSLDANLRAKAEGAAVPERDPSVTPAPVWDSGKIVPEVEPETPTTAKAEGDTARKPRSMDIADLDQDAVEDAMDMHFDPDMGKGSIGARQLNQTSMGLKASTDVISVIQDAKTYVQQHSLTDYFYDYAAAERSGSKVSAGTSKTMRVVADTIGSVPAFAQDFDRLMRSGSSVAMKIAHTTGSDGAARNTNVNSAAHIQKDYSTELQSIWREPYVNASKSYVKRNGGGSLFTPLKNLELERQFNKDIFLETEHAARTGVLRPNIDPDVKAAVEALNAAWKREAEIGRGDGVTNAVAGYEHITPRDWYVPHRVSSGSVVGRIREVNKKAVRHGGRTITEQDVEDMFAEAYGQFSLTKADARTVAKAILARSKSRDRGANISLYGLLQENNTDFLEQMLKANNISQSDVDRIMRTLVDDVASRGKSGHTRRRLDMDIRFQASNGLKIIDFIDTDVNRIATTRMQSTSGWAALARNGIKSQVDIDRIIQAAEHEMADAINNPLSFGDALKNPSLKGKVSDTISAGQDFLDKDRPVNRAFLEAWFGQFTGAGKTLDDSVAIASRVKKGVGLSTLNGLGIPQLMESSNILAYTGFKDFMKYVPQAIRSDLGNARSNLVQELRVLGKMHPEEKLYDLGTHAELDQTLHAKSSMAFWMDRALGKGMELQGMITGMHKIREWQKRTVILVTADRLFKQLAHQINRTGDPHISQDRLASMGFNRQLQSRLQDQIKAGHVVFDADGDVLAFNTKNWGDEELVQQFSRALGIATDQAVQATRKGEGNLLLTNNGIMSLMTQFLSYPITAINKQAARNAYIGDTEAAMSFLYGVALAGTISTARAVAYNRTEDISLANIAKNGFVNSNLTGWIPLAADPVLNLLGMDDYKFDQYARMIRTPPALEVIPRMLRSPFALAGLILGDTSKENMRDVRALPLIGNWYGTQAILNRL